MDNLMIPVEFMKVGYVVATALIALYFFTVFVKNEFTKFIMYFFKFLAYFGLAYFMWEFYKTREGIDIVSAFTFIFCCIESADNIISFLSIPIEYMRKIHENRKMYEIQKMNLDKR